MRAGLMRVSSPVTGRRAAAELLNRMHQLRGTFGGLTFYERFEHAVVLILTALIIVVVGVATWHLTLAVLALVLADEIHPANQAVFQAIFGMVFTVIIALEFKHSLLIALARQESVVRLRSVILIAMLAMVRKFIVLDLGTSAPGELLALAAAILALGTVYWARSRRGRCPFCRPDDAYGETRLAG
jgi:uncharacterized membrane protein (DUF373 family)